MKTGRRTPRVQCPWSNLFKIEKKHPAQSSPLYQLTPCLSVLPSLYPLPERLFCHSVAAALSLNSSLSHLSPFLSSCGLCSFPILNPFFTSLSILLYHQRGRGSSREGGSLRLEIVLNNTCLLERSRGGWHGWRRDYRAGYRVLIAGENGALIMMRYEQAGWLQSGNMIFDKSIRFTQV